MQTIRVALSVALASAIAVPLSLAAPFTTGVAGATVAIPTLVYAADIDRDGVAGLYRTTTDDPTHPTAVLADTGKISVDKALLSPDGTRIAVLYDPDAANPDETFARRLVTMNLDGSNQHVLVTESNVFGQTATMFNDVNGFGWKGNDTIAYGWSTAKYSANPTVYTDEVRTVPADGGASATVTGTTGYADPSVSPDGTQIVAVNFGNHTASTSLAVFPSTGIASTPTSLATGTLRSPAWSTDGTAIVFVRDDSSDTLDASELDVTRFDSGSSTWSTAAAAVPVVQGADSSWLDEDPFWTDANTLMFERIDDSSSAAGDTQAPIDLWTAAFNTGTSTWGTASKVADTPDVDEWSPSTAPADTTPPSAVTFGAFTLGGTSVTLHWTTPDADYSHVTLHRTDNTAGTPAVDIPGNVFGTSYVDKNLVVGHDYTYTADTFDGAGNQATSEASHQVTPTYAPKIVAPSPTALVTTHAAFRVTWGAIAGQPAGTTYDVDYATKGGSNWALGASTHLVRGSTATNGVINGVLGQTYYIRAAAHDTFGNNSSITPWSAVNVAYDQKNGQFSSGWVTADNSAFWLGSIAYTVKNGTVFVIYPTSKSVSIIGTKCPSCGKFAVYVDGHYRGTVSTASSTTKLRQILWTGVNSTISRHQIKLVSILGSRQRLNIDGVADPR